MKSIKLILLLMLACSLSVVAQDDDEDYKYKPTKTIVGNSNRVSGFGSIELRTTKIKDELALLPGFTGGVILNNSFIMGIGGYGIATEIGFDGFDPPTRQYLYGGYGGLVLGGILAPKEIIHIYVPVLIGAGGAYISENGFDDLDNDNEFDESSAFFVVEPGIEIELNVTRFFRIGIGGSYRYILESDLVNASDSELSNYSGNISFKFGGF